MIFLAVLDSFCYLAGASSLGMWIIAPRPGIKPISDRWEATTLTPQPPGSPIIFLRALFLFCFFFKLENLLLPSPKSSFFSPHPGRNQEHTKVGNRLIWGHCVLAWVGTVYSELIVKVRSAPLCVAITSALLLHVVSYPCAWALPYSLGHSPVRFFIPITATQSRYRLISPTGLF